jgi:hypothetical protein
MLGRCWLCGKYGFRKQKHHVIPQCLNPKKNTTIPLCKECHKKVHKDISMKNIGREKIIFEERFSKDGKTKKLMGRTYDGCIIFPDKSTNIEIIPNKEYFVTVYKYGNSAFARDIKEVV